MKSILVVDDDDQLREAIRRILKAEGHLVFEAADGLLALELLKKESIDLVITDIFMPNQDGIGAIMEIREKYPAVKIIASSVGGRLPDVDYLNLAKNVGAHGTITKPFLLDEFIEKVNEMLK